MIKYDGEKIISQREYDKQLKEQELEKLRQHVARQRQEAMIQAMPTLDDFLSGKIMVSCNNYKEMVSFLSILECLNILWGARDKPLNFLDEDRIVFEECLYFVTQYKGTLSLGWKYNYCIEGFPVVAFSDLPITFLPNPYPPARQ